MICYINRSTVDYDVRLNKYVQACKVTGTSYFVIAWDRLLNAKHVDNNEYQMKFYCPYAQGKKIIPLLRWFFFVWYYLIKNFNKYKVIHACNMENAIIALPFKLLGKKIVFDVYDSQYTKIERYIASKVDCLILPTEKRLEQIGLTRSQVSDFIEIENVPTFDVSLQPISGLCREKVYLSYVGVLQKQIRGIENLLNLVSADDRFILDIAGVGDDLETVVKCASELCDRIHYHGKVQYVEALDIMNNSDFIVALYYPCCSNHIYASPNKSYEALYLSTPIITSKGTLVGDLVEKNNTGYIVDDTLEGLSSMFNDIETVCFKQDYHEKCINCSNRWRTVYSDYKKQILEGQYISTIRAINKC